MNYTSVKQSKKLLELGMNPESADAFYFMGKEPVDIEVIYGFTTHKHLREQMAYKRAIPCWSVGALLEVMPKQLPNYRSYEKNFWYDNFENKWNAAYIYYKVYDSESGEVYPSVYDDKTFTADNLMDACYNMVVWLLESGLLGHKVN